MIVTRFVEHQELHTYEEVAAAVLEDTQVADYIIEGVMTTIFSREGSGDTVLNHELRLASATYTTARIHRAQEVLAWFEARLEVD
jgi:hypothetical protein